MGMRSEENVARESLKQSGAHVNIGDILVSLLAPAVARSAATPWLSLARRLQISGIITLKLSV